MLTEGCPRACLRGCAAHGAHDRETCVSVACDGAAKDAARRPSLAVASAPVGLADVSSRLLSEQRARVIQGVGTSFCCLWIDRIAFSSAHRRARAFASDT